MSRVGPLVLLTKSAIDEKNLDAPSATMLRYTWMAPKKKHEEEMQRQAYAALRASKDDFVILLGDRVENYRRRHKSSGCVTGKLDIGLESAPNKPYVAHGGAPEHPAKWCAHFRFPPGQEAEKRRKQMLKREDGIPTSVRRKPSNGRPIKLQELSSTSVPIKRSAFGRNTSQTDHEDEPMMRADTMLELMLSNPAKAQTIKNRQNKIGHYFQDLEEGNPTGPLTALPAKASRTSTAPGQLFREFGFPKAELKKSYRRLDLARKGGTFVTAVEAPNDAQNLFPHLDVQAMISQGTTCTKDKPKFFVTEQEDESGCPIPATEARKMKQVGTPQVGFAEQTVEAQITPRSGFVVPEPFSTSEARQVSLYPEHLEILDDSDHPAPSTYRNYLVEQFDDMDPETLDEVVYWQVRFEHTKHKLQNQLVENLQSRLSNRDKVYGSAQHLAMISKAGQEQAGKWLNCRQVATAPPGSPDVWSDRTQTMERSEALLGQRIEFWQRLGSYVSLIGEVDDAVQVLVDHIRRLLIEREVMDKRFFLATMKLFVNYPEAQASRGVWALISFMRAELNVDICEMADMAKQLGLDLPQEQLGIGRHTDLLSAKPPTNYSIASLHDINH